MQYVTTTSPTTVQAAKPTTPTPATLLVTLPSNAKLSIDGTPTTSTSAIRRFITPSLDPAKEYSYSLKAELTENGQTYTAEKTVTVSAGQETRVEIDIPRTSVASR